MRNTRNITEKLQLKSVLGVQVKTADRNVQLGFTTSDV